ncbi:molybdopterin-guanine dinucleotide biosynthesis protein B [Lentibacillus sp. JNUCC-1]|uniref:molybdopterin-guanine dinucleotide biosynthesis protein B n=1 Tax=Lentibacillus sp. JNUCC-1 TaxID=2654513 RepID=UPI0018D23074|nr:molybdopterin-guanine dinucleotide biosynthesis protein B [Lentibacillus sp. JNUCC-1]
MSARDDFPIFQVVGYKNSGKTTVTSALVAYLTKAGYKVATLKHHGHGGKPDRASGTDSDKHRQAGAVISGVEGDGELQLTVASKTELTWEQIKTMYQTVSHDILILEGYKNASFPKIVLLREEADFGLLNDIDQIHAVGLRDHHLMPDHHAFTFLLEDLDKVLPDLVAHLLDRFKL